MEMIDAQLLNAHIGYCQNGAVAAFEEQICVLPWQACKTWRSSPPHAQASRVVIAGNAAVQG